MGFSAAFWLYEILTDGARNTKTKTALFIVTEVIFVGRGNIS